jgi:hypothetical protein
MTGNGRHYDESLIAALAGGASVTRAAQMVALSERTVCRRLEDAAFRTAVGAVRAEMLTSAVGVLARAATAAAATLQHLISSTYPPSTRLAAARSVLELGTRLREAEELEARLVVLEAVLAEREGT